MQQLTGRSIVIALALTLTSSSWAQVQTSGSGARGAVNQSMAFGGSVALLNAFNLDFGYGNDHHIRGIRVLPDENAGQVSIAYYDQNSDDPFRWQASFWGITNAAVRTGAVSGQCRGACTTTVMVPAGYMFVLRGFESNYLSEDHHIKTIGVEHGGSTLHVYMSDDNGDDLFNYRVRYALVPTSLLTTWSQAAGNGVGSAQAALTAGKTVLRGFMFSFSNSDHHISRIAVSPQQANLRVNYADKNADDSFAWRVQWANLR